MSEPRNLFPGVPLAGTKRGLPGSASRAYHSSQNQYSLFPPMHETNFSEQYKKYAHDSRSPG